MEYYDDEFEDDGQQGDTMRGTGELPRDGEERGDAQEPPGDAQEPSPPGLDTGEWEFVPNMESPGHDLMQLEEGLSEEDLRRRCLLEGAVAVTSLGVLKSALEPQEAWERVSEDGSRGMFVFLGLQPPTSNAGEVERPVPAEADAQAPALGSPPRAVSPRAPSPREPSEGERAALEQAAMTDPDPLAEFSAHLLGPEDADAPGAEAPGADGAEEGEWLPHVQADGEWLQGQGFSTSLPRLTDGQNENSPPGGLEETTLNGLFHGDPDDAQPPEGAGADAWSGGIEWNDGQCTLLQDDSFGATPTVPENSLAIMPPLRGPHAGHSVSMQAAQGSVLSQRSAKSGHAADAEISASVRWEQSTTDRLNHARSLTKKAVKAMIESNAAHGFAKKYNSNSGIVSQSIKKKIDKTGDMCKALDGRIESVEDTIRQVGECLFRLQRAHRCKWAPLNVCERRLELREGRPIQELVRDDVHAALESERSTLVGARSSLELHLSKMREAIMGLDRAHRELREDLQHKRHALRIDRSCLSPKKPLQHTGAEDRLVLPSLQDVGHYGAPPSPKDTRRGTGLLQEVQRQETTQDLLARACRAEEDAMHLAHAGQDLMATAERACVRATQQTNAALARRVEETQALKAQLEAHIIQTDDTIAQMEMSLAMTRQSLESHERPLRALDTQFATRGRRTEREGIRDPVHDEMEGHLDQLKTSVRELSEKFSSTKQILEQLRSSKQHLQQDYKNKSLAQKIDDACIKVTARKAMELDRNDPRGGRCREPARRKQRSVPPMTLDTSNFMDALTF